MRHPAITKVLPGLALWAVALGPLQAQEPATPPSLTVVSWGGAYTRSQILSYVVPYEQQAGARIEVEDYNGGLDQIRAQVDSYNTRWDLVDMELPDVIRGCEEGLLEKIDHSMLPAAPDGTPAQEDFLPGLLPECGVGQVVFSTVMAYDTTRFADEPPQSLKDFFDTSKYPGKRGLRRTPRINLEWALMADGVAPEKVYETLSTAEGVQQALEKLDDIKSHIVWWESGAEPAQLLANGEVAMTSAWNGRIADAIDKGTPAAIVWDHQVWEFDLWAIPKRTRNHNLQSVLDFVTFATTTERLAEQAKYIAYGPARKSSMGLVPEEARPELPTAEVNTATALHLDGQWWAENQSRLERQFNEWVGRRSFFFGGGIRP
jgi:putative spermidine/putrescine transport system substrate-binding protein